MKHINFSGKSVIVTGGGTGIGYEIAKSFLSCGAMVNITGRREVVLAKSLLAINNEMPESKSKIIFTQGDMSEKKSVIKVFEKSKKYFKKVDILINNCGSWTLKEINNLENREIENQFNNNLKSTIIATQISTKYLGLGGIIINLGSFAGILPIKKGSMYSLLKSAIISFTKSSASEFGSKGIRVNCVIPGVVRTPMTTDYIDENYNRLIEPIALRKIGTCEEVANGVMFLASEFSSYITGTTLEITGGKYLTQL